jgi:hypothetical protein
MIAPPGGGAMYYRTERGLLAAQPHLVPTLGEARSAVEGGEHLLPRSGPVITCRSPR